MDLRSYPKVELHRHLEGALRLQTLFELAQDPWGSASKFLILEPMQDLKTVLGKFAATQSLLKTPEILTRIAYEAVEDAAQEGIRILELRYSPTFIRAGHEHMSFEQIHTAILRGLEKAKHLPIATGLICIFQRTQSAAEQQRVLDFVRDTRETWIGVDLADNEQDHPAREFKPFFASTQNLGLPSTIHAGEALHPSSPQNVIDAITELGASRIGHGLQIAGHQAALDLVRARQIPLELCPTSNWITSAVPDIAVHPFRELMSQGVLCTLNSDDPGIFGIDLVHEYEIMQKHFAMTEAEFNTCNDIAARASFIPMAQKQKYWPRKIN